jgi:hypothetical protein
MFLRNVSWLSTDYLTLYPTRQNTSIWKSIVFFSSLDAFQVCCFQYWLLYKVGGLVIKLFCSGITDEVSPFNHSRPNVKLMTPIYIPPFNYLLGVKLSCMHAPRGIIQLIILTPNRWVWRQHKICVLRCPVRTSATLPSILNEATPHVFQSLRLAPRQYSMSQ